MKAKVDNITVKNEKINNSIPLLSKVGTMLNHFEFHQNDVVSFQIRIKMGIKI